MACPQSDVGVLLLLLLLITVSVEAEYTWNGSDWVWNEEGVRNSANNQRYFINQRYSSKKRSVPFSCLLMEIDRWNCFRLL